MNAFHRLNPLYVGIRLKEENALLCSAAAKGNRDSMVSAKAMGATNFGVAAIQAAKGGHVECLKQGHEWGKEIYTESINAFGGEDFAKLIWVPLNSILATAAIEGHAECMKLAKKWGATNINGALRLARSGRDAECIRLAERWAKRGDRDMEIIKIAVEWDEYEKAANAKLQQMRRETDQLITQAEKQKRAEKAKN